MYLMFSMSFKNLTEHIPFARKIVNYGIIPNILITIFINITINKYKIPNVK